VNLIILSDFFKEWIIMKYSYKSYFTHKNQIRALKQTIVIQVSGK